MSKRQRRPQAPKRQGRANPEYHAAMVELRRSNATVPVPSGRTYRRKDKHNRWEE